MASEIRVNQIQNRSGLGTITVSQDGFVVSGIVTANSFSGDITGNVTGNISGATATLTGNIDMKTGGSGSLILGDDQFVKFGDSNELTIQHSAPSGPSGANFIEGDTAGKNLFIRSKLNQDQLKLVPDGQVEAYFAGSKKFETTGSGTITTGIITAIGGNSNEGSFLTGTSVGIGTTTTAGKNAGVSTANGTLVYNSSINQLEVYANNQWNRVRQQAPVAVSGGTVSNDVNRTNFVTHTFTSPGNFVTAGQLTSAEIFVIGGGAGGGGRRYGGGGGAGGAMLATGVTLDSGTYSVVVGSGGAGGTYPGPNNGNRGTDGSNSIFGPGGPQQRQGTGGGGGGAMDDNKNGRDGGCGGGASSTPPSSGGSSTQPSAPGPGTDYGNRGGNYTTPGGGWAPLGGGGTGAAAADSSTQINGGGNGGAGVQLSISGTATYYGGGGGGSIYNSISPTAPTPGSPQIAPANHKSFGGAGGGGTGGTNPDVTIPPNSSPNQNATANTGSGGAGAHSSSQNFSTGAGGNGAAGLVIVAYPSIDNAVTT